MKFKVGDRVVVYESTGFYTGTIYKIEEGHQPSIIVDINDYPRSHTSSQAPMPAVFPQQCRRLNPRKKKLTVTREQLKRAWEDHVGLTRGSPFNDFVEALGLQET